jgi:hypothetical protein
MQEQTGQTARTTLSGFSFFNPVSSKMAANKFYSFVIFHPSK